MNFRCPVFSILELPQVAFFKHRSERLKSQARSDKVTWRVIKLRSHHQHHWGFKTLKRLEINCSSFALPVPVSRHLRTCFFHFTFLFFLFSWVLPKMSHTNVQFPPSSQAGKHGICWWPLKRLEFVINKPKEPVIYHYKMKNLDLKMLGIWSDLANVLVSWLC